MMFRFSQSYCSGGVRRWDEQNQEYVLRFDDLAGQGSRHAPHYDHSLDPVERRLAKSQEGARGHNGQGSSSPRFSQHHNQQKDEHYITPTHSQLSQYRKEGSR